MILTLRSNILTRFGSRNGYAFTDTVEQTPELSDLLASLLGWLSANLADGETLSDVVLEQVGSVPTGWTQPDENGTQEPTGYREVISAAVSVQAPLGSRTFTVSSEVLPTELRDGLLTAWGAISGSSPQT